MSSEYTAEAVMTDFMVSSDWITNTFAYFCDDACF